MLSTAERYEAGTFNIPGTLGLGASLNLIAEVGVATISKLVKEVTDHLVERLMDINCPVTSPRDAQHWSGIVSFTLPGKDPSLAFRELRRQKVIVAARDGRLRASPHYYNNREDIERFVAAIESIRGKE